MKQISKNQQPPKSLVEHLTKPHSFYSNLPTSAKNDLRINLAIEQGYICCYCMQRIAEATEHHMKVEHFKDQDHYPQYQLIYSNLFAACLGNEGKPGHLQTCDTKKGNKSLIINPTLITPNCESLFKYNAEGEISSINDDITINKAINEVLNLNMQTLKDRRREVYLEVQKRVRDECRQLGRQPLKLGYLTREKERWLSTSENRHRPFCMVAVYYLNKRIQKIRT